ncbi:MAG: CehA/McbA family metallohydrolase [Sumerlaeia bacterium]
MMNRRHFFKATALGMGALWTFGGERALAQIPWEDEKESTPVADDERLALTRPEEVGEGLRSESPRLALADEGKVLLLWVTADHVAETLWAGEFVDGAFGAGHTLVRDEGVMHPALAYGEVFGALAVWAQKAGERWALRGAFGPDWGEAVEMDEGEAELNWHPAVAVAGERAFVAWERKVGGAFEIVGRWIDGQGGLGKITPVSHGEGKDARRPAVAPDGEGGVWVAWDHAERQGGSGVRMRHLAADGGVGEELRVTHHPAFNHAPALTLGANGDVWVAWHSNRRGEDRWDIPRWIYVRCLRGGEFLDPAEPMRDKNLDKEGTDQSFEFARLAALPGGGVVITGRPSHNFCVQALGAAGWSPLYRLPQDGWGGRGQFLCAEADGEGGLWVVRRDLGANVLQRLTGLDGFDGVPRLMPSREADGAAAALANINHAPKRWDALEDLEGIGEPLLGYFGDVHGHTWMSDGVGDVDEYFRTRREYYEDDFCALTDHDTFVRNSILPSEFEYQKELTDHYHVDGRFVTLFGQEYTTGRVPIRIGHKCILSTRKDVPLMDHTNPDYRTTPQVNAALRERGGIWIPHHTGWLGTDWEEAEVDVQPLVEICSNHGRFEYMGNRPIPHRGGMRGGFVQDALAMGLRIGIIGGSDSHGLIWHHHMARRRDCHRTGLAVVLAPELTREAIFDAMKRRRTYGTTGNKPRLDFRIDDHVMGSEFETENGEVEILARVTSREDILWMTVVKDNKVWYEYGGGDFDQRFTIGDEIAPGEEHFYYLRVEFEGEHMAWSSPIWVKRTAA